MKKKLFPRLPKSIKVRSFKGESGKWIIEIKKYDLFAQTDSLDERDFLVNDLIYMHFEVPKSSQKFVRYVPKELTKERKATTRTPLMFEKFFSTSFAFA